MDESCFRKEEGEEEEEEDEEERDGGVRRASRVAVRAKARLEVKAPRWVMGREEKGLHANPAARLGRRRKKRRRRMAGGKWQRFGGLGLDELQHQ